MNWSTRAVNTWPKFRKISLKEMAEHSDMIDAEGL